MYAVVIKCVYIPTVLFIALPVIVGPSKLMCSHDNFIVASNSRESTVFCRLQGQQYSLTICKAHYTRHVDILYCMHAQLMFITVRNQLVNNICLAFKPESNTLKILPKML